LLWNNKNMSRLTFVDCIKQVTERAQAICCRLLKAEARVQPHSSRCGIYGER
jgi:hypothetical protein